MTRTNSFIEGEILTACKRRGVRESIAKDEAARAATECARGGLVSSVSRRIDEAIAAAVKRERRMGK